MSSDEQAPLLSDPAAENKKPARQLGFFEKLSWFAKVYLWLGKALFAKLTLKPQALTSKLQTNPKFLLLRHICAYGASAPELLLLNPPTLTSYHQFCKSASLEPNSVPLSHGAVAHWLGATTVPSSPDARVVLYLHGGGFMLGCGVDQLRFHQSLVSELSLTHPGSAGVLLEYSLSHEHSYPRQLTQSVTVLAYLLQQCGWAPGQIILAGESAGGNLVFGVLQHLLRNNPHVPVPLSLPWTEPLAGAIAISPWVDMRDFPADHPNHGVDYLTAAQITAFRDAYVEGVHDAGVDTRWTDFSGATPQEWWDGLGGVCREVLVTAYSEEVLVDQVREFAEVVKGRQGGDRGAKVEVFVDPGVHAECAISFGERKEDVVGWLRVLEWVRERL